MNNQTVFTPNYSDSHQHTHNLHRCMKFNSNEELKYYTEKCKNANDYQDYIWFAKWFKWKGIEAPKNKYGFTPLNRTGGFMIGTVITHYNGKIDDLKAYYKKEVDAFKSLLEDTEKEYIYSLINRVHSVYKHNKKLFDYTLLYVFIHDFEPISMTRFRNIATANGDPIRAVNIIPEVVNLLKTIKPYNLI